MIKSPDGSLNIELDTEGTGLYTPDGYIRCTTYVEETSPLGLYARDGSYNVVIDSEGTGSTDPSGSLRVSTDAGTGAYDASGAYRVNITNP